MSWLAFDTRSQGEPPSIARAPGNTPLYPTTTRPISSPLPPITASPRITLSEGHWGVEGVVLWLWFHPLLTCMNRKGRQHHPRHCDDEHDHIGTDRHAILIPLAQVVHRVQRDQPMSSNAKDKAIRRASRTGS